jgi:hypothetical protein
VPTIAIVWPIAWIALVPVVIVEAAFACRVLNWSFSRAFWMSLVANFISTLVGLPIGSCLNPLPLLGLFNRWFYLPGIVISLYGVSVVCEALVAGKFEDLYVSRRSVWRWSLFANATSYGLIFTVLLALWLIDWS